MEAAFPGRAAQIRTLRDVLGLCADGDAFALNKTVVCPSMYLWGSASTGKTSIVRALMEEAKGSIKWAYFNCLEASNPKVIFERCLNQLAGVQPTIANNYETYRRCSTLAEFVRHLRDLVKADRQRPRYIVIDQCERMRELGSTVLATFLRLGELTSGNIGVVLIGTTVWDKFRPTVGCRDPILVHFPDYARDDSIRILALDCPSPDVADLFNVFVDLLYSTFHGPCRDLNELRHLTSLLFPKYIEPVSSGALTKRDTVKLFHQIQPYFKQMLDKLYLREVSRSEWEQMTRPQAVESNSAAAAASAVATSRFAAASASAAETASTVASLESVAAKATSALRSLELPYHSRFLLLAAFLASFNPPRLDQRYFTKSDAKKAPRKRKASKAAAGGTATEMKQQYQGPRTFPLERLIAIFHHILAEPVETTVDLQSQLANLVSLQLVAQVSHSEHIESPTYRCLLKLDEAHQLAQSVSFTLNHYLFDFATS